MIVSTEAWRVNQQLMATARDRIGGGVASMLEFGSTITPELEQQCREAQTVWSGRLRQLVSDTTLLALPTLQTLPPPLGDENFDGSTLNMPVNLAGLPALAVPVATGGRLPASLQLVGPPGGEELLLAVGRVIEAAQ
jgi:Asp-tRNA(Asn)/Glu-tRNA(Gln) amidotransferase A subunit family amidase